MFQATNNGVFNIYHTGRINKNGLETEISCNTNYKPDTIETTTSTSHIKCMRKQSMYRTTNSAQDSSNSVPKTIKSNNTSWKSSGKSMTSKCWLIILIVAVAVVLI